MFFRRMVRFAVALTVVSGAVVACQGDDNTLPLPDASSDAHAAADAPSDGTHDAPSEGAAIDSAALDGSPIDSAVSDASASDSAASPDSIGTLEASAALDDGAAEAALGLGDATAD